MQHPKGILIDRCKQLGLGKPAFSTRNTGPEHGPTFMSEVRIGGEVYGTGQGGSKREAERRASEQALEALERQNRAGTPEGVNAEPFEGPWPIFAEVLASSLVVANSRVEAGLTGTEAIREVQTLALHLYKESLEALGEVVELEA